MSVCVALNSAVMVFFPCVCVSMNIVKWSSQGMLRLTQEAMNELFQPTITKIVKHIGKKDYGPETGALQAIELNITPSRQLQWA